MIEAKKYCNKCEKETKHQFIYVADRNDAWQDECFYDDFDHKQRFVVSNLLENTSSANVFLKKCTVCGEEDYTNKDVESFEDD